MPPPLPPPKVTHLPDPAEEQLARAQELFDAGNFSEAAAAAEQAAGSPTFGKRARELAGNAWFAVGDIEHREGRLIEALAAYRKAEPTREDAAAAIENVERLAREKAEEYYNAGVRSFINQDLDAAILSWELTLALNPAHPNAARDIEKARGLLRKLEEIR